MMEALRYAIHKLLGPTHIKLLVCSLILALSTASASKGYVPNGRCVEEEETKTLLCKEAYTDDVKTFLIYNTIETFICDNCTIKVLTKNIFDNPHLRNLVVIKMNDNRINAVEEDVFGNLTALETINLSNNTIHYLPSKIFKKSYNLTSLDLSGNKIINIKREHFSSLTTLKELSLANNRIVNITTNNMFWDLMNLERLDLHGNLITKLESDMFFALKFLTYINFSNNSVAQLEGELFSGAENLETVDLSHNKITAISKRDFMDNRPDGNNIKKLLLNNNEIETIAETSLKFFQKLTILDLANNNLLFVGGKTLSGLPQLKELYLQNNKLKILELSLKSLRKLDISNNSFQTFPNDQFSRVSSLESLDMSQNHITRMSEKVFSSLLNLSSLRIDKKLFENLDFRSLSKHMKKLTIVKSCIYGHCRSISCSGKKKLNSDIRTLITLERFGWECLEKVENVNVSTPQLSPVSTMQTPQTETVTSILPQGLSSAVPKKVNNVITDSTKSPVITMSSKTNEPSNNIGTESVTMIAIPPQPSTTVRTTSTTTTVPTTTTPTTTIPTTTTTTAEPTPDPLMKRIFQDLNDIKIYNEGNMIIQIVLLIILFMIILLLVALILIIKKKNSSPIDNRSVGYVDDCHLELLAS